MRRNVQPHVQPDRCKGARPVAFQLGEQIFTPTPHLRQSKVEAKSEWVFYRQMYSITHDRSVQLQSNDKTRVGRRIKA